MAFWVREIAGWALVGTGLFVFLLALGLMETSKFIQAGLTVGMGIALFRGGIQLIKVATAARIVAGEERRRSSADALRREK